MLQIILAFSKIRYKIIGIVKNKISGYFKLIHVYNNFPHHMSTICLPINHVSWRQLTLLQRKRPKESEDREYLQTHSVRRRLDHSYAENTKTTVSNSE